MEQTRKRPLFIVDKRTGGVKADSEKTDIPFFDLEVVSRPVIQSMIESSERVLRSSQVILGPELIRFEREFSSLIGVKSALGLASGTDAITIALWASGIMPDDLVVYNQHDEELHFGIVEKVKASHVYASDLPFQRYAIKRYLLEDVFKVWNIYFDPDFEHYF